MRRARVLVACLVVVLAVLAGAAPIVSAAAPPPKVVLVVGPVGATTERYRRLADEAAAEARRFTPNVVRVYSPNATWPAVKRALQGASIVVYLGHGNGWPSPHRANLAPSSQNGFGLNPIGGADDSTHQYFGESSIASEVRLAPNAVVLLHHLCYASGNSEPGVPEGGLDLAQKRVDNFAAGFLRAGAGAVLAEAHSGPAWFVRQLFTARRSIDSIWRSAPSFNDHVLRFASRRSPGHVALLDPDRETSGFHRSLVLRPGLSPGDVQAAAVTTGPISGDPLAILPNSLLDLGLTVRPPALVDAPVAGSRTVLAVGYQTLETPLPEGLEVGVRWDPLDVPVLVPEPATPVADPPTTANPSPGPNPTEAPAAPAPSLAPVPPAAPKLVVAESPGSVVAPSAARVGKRAVALEVEVPEAPGLYRLVTTLHDQGGVAYDAATQALVPALLVRVTAPMAAHYAVAPIAEASAGSAIEVPVTVTNLGREMWGLPSPHGPRSRHADARSAPLVLVVRWIGLDAGSRVSDAPEPVEIPLAASLRPGVAATVSAFLAAPDTTGEYLLMLDVVLPGDESLAGVGVPPGLVRVTVR